MSIQDFTEQILQELFLLLCFILFIPEKYNRWVIYYSTLIYNIFEALIHYLVSSDRIKVLKLINCLLLLLLRFTMLSISIINLGSY